MVICKSETKVMAEGRGTNDPPRKGDASMGAIPPQRLKLAGLADFSDEVAKAQDGIPERIALCDPASLRKSLARREPISHRKLPQIDYEAIYRYCKIGYCVERAMALFHESATTHAEERFRAYMRQYTSWRVTVVQKADPVLAEAVEDPVTIWICAELETLSFARHRNQALVALVGQPSIVLEPCISRFLENGGHLLLVCFPDAKCPIQDRVADHSRGCVLSPFDCKSEDWSAQSAISLN